VPDSNVRQGNAMMVNLRISVVVVGLTVLAQSGCAIGWTDKSGARHLIGLVDVSIRPGDDTRLAGDIVEVSTIGASVLSESHTTSFTLGYSRTTTAAFRDNALALGPFDRIVADGTPKSRTKSGE